jgi:hypothetical protein
MEFSEMPCAKAVRGRRLGANASAAGFRKARAVPKPTRITKIGHTCRKSESVKTNKTKSTGNFNKQAQGYDQPAIELVGNESRDQHEQQGGKKLRQAHKAKIKRISGEIINLPTHGYRHDLHGKTGGA